MNFYYNIADVTENIASNEGFGISWNESLHAGTPVLTGNKYIANIWLREKEYDLTK